MYIPRSLEPDIKNNLFKGKVVIVYGPRQAGKTTLVKKIAAEEKKTTSYFNCDEGDIRDLLNRADTSSQLKEIIGDNDLVILDEAQRIDNIGLKLKLLVDNFPQQQVIATGSSAFELRDKITEPLTGRNFQFVLPPFSCKELVVSWDKTEISRQLENLILYGSYPAVINSGNVASKELLAKQLAGDNLYKDVLKFFNLKGSETVRKLLAGLALQIGQEVAYEELGNLAGVDKKTAMVYVEVLEKAFIIFRLRPFSRNLRKEINKRHKIFFYDTGIRNALLNNFNSLSLRSDRGPLWENFVIAERYKWQYWAGNCLNNYFWRTYDQQEIDLIEEKSGRLRAMEIKWQKERKAAPKAWQETYPNSIWQSVNKDNFLEFLD
jgi:predicted AAA+ superfamily ATPase